MADFVHCNKCLARPKQQPAAKFFITTCYHLICERCKGEDAPGTPCKICTKPMKALEINRDLDKRLQEMFMSPKQILTQRMTALKKKQDFHKMMFNSLLNYYKKQKSKLDQAMQYFQKQASAIKEKDKQITELKQWLSTAEQKLSVMETERDTLQRELAELRQMESRVAATNMESSIDHLFATQAPREVLPFNLTGDLATHAQGYESDDDFNDSVVSSRPTTISMNSPAASNSSVVSEITTPKMLGIRNKSSPCANSLFAQRSSTSSNPYMDVFNRSAPRSNRAQAHTPSHLRNSAISTTPVHRSGGHRGDSAKYKSFSPGVISHGSIIPKSNTPSAARAGHF